MQKEVITDQQGIALMFLFIIGESSILVSGLSANQDAWIAIILAGIAAFPLMMLYIKLLKIFPRNNLFDIIECCFGKSIGKIIIFLYAIYSFDLATLVLIDFIKFFQAVGLPDTPIIVPTIFFMFLCISITKEGIEVMGRWSQFIMLILIVLIIFTIFLLIPNMNLNNIQPILSSGIKPVLKGSYEVFIYPFGETVIFSAFLFSTKHKNSIYTIYTRGLLLGGITLLLTSFIILLVLGVKTASTDFYPAYTMVTRINISDLLQRIEVIAAVVFILGGFIKVSVYLLTTCKGFSKTFNCKDYAFIITPISLLIINVTSFEFKSVMEFNEYIFSAWIYYAFIFMVIIPVLTLIIAILKKYRLS
ncbi:MAG: endospore germination permease [Marinisporobacter sp.]|jgi:spore germination protein KB|nr:endospore germination permease [Marinisporobacter sp.]